MVSGFNRNITEFIYGHKEVRSALRDTSTYSSDLQGDADVRDYRQIPLEVDPPRHHLYRAALAPYFVKPAIEMFASQFRQNSRHLIAEFFSEPNEVVENLALKLVMRNLGVIYNRPQDVDEWLSWGPDVWTAAGPVRSGEVLHTYMDRIYAEAQVGGYEDMWSEISRLEIEGKRVSADEFRGIVGVLLAGGRDTVVKLITGIVWHLGNRPDELELLKSNPELIPNAIQEFLRFLSPLPAMARTTSPESLRSNLEDGDYVQISFISANFDEAVFEQPTKIQLRRNRIPHLSFGFGPHTCIGNHVAEIEARIFLEELIESGVSWSIDTKSEIVFHEQPLTMVPDRFVSLFVQ